MSTPQSVPGHSDRQQAELRRTNRIVNLLRSCNQAMLRAGDEQELLGRICSLIVEIGGYRMAWVGYAQPDEARTVRPVAKAGFEDGYLKTVNVTWADNDRGRGPVGTSIRTARPSIAQNVLTEPKFQPWRIEAARRGYAACIGLPLTADGRTFGSLAIYAAAPDAFDPQETDLLMELASDLAFGIMSLRMRLTLRLNESRLNALLKLSEMTDAPLQQITDFAMEEGVRLTGSTVGYLAFMSEDESILTMHSWSKAAMAQCEITDKPLVYPVVTTGLWGEAVRQRRPIITNDYTAQNIPGKKGYPPGHVPVTRHMNVPVFDEQRIVAVAGVANKSEPYDDSDVTQLRLLMDGMWRLLQRKRAIDTVRQLNEQLEERVRQRTAELADAVNAERAALQSLKSAQSQLVQSEKLAALGQMVAGVAHEINNPLSFVGNNLAVLGHETRAMRELLLLYRRLEPILQDQHPQEFAPIRELAGQIDLPYVLENLDDLVGRSRDGLRRIEQIVRDLRTFVRLDESDLHEVDLNEGIESTVNIVRGRARAKKVEISLDLGRLPAVACYPARINQVIMNLLANAIDACGEGGTVKLCSRRVDGGVEIEVTDDGRGVDPSIRERLFQPFVTTKPPGEGTGLGLSISHSIVSEHGGTIRFDSRPGRTRFRVALPLHPPVPPGAQRT